MKKVNVSNIAKWCQITFNGDYSHPFQYSYGGRLYFNDEEITSLIIPDGVTAISANSFKYCIGLNSAKIAQSVTKIGEQAFSNCYNLEEVELPDNLQRLENKTFYGCKIKNVTIPASVQYIYSQVFDFGSVESVRVKAETPPFMNPTAFSKYDIPLYVPDNSIETYKNANPWNQFSLILPLSSADKYKLTYTVDGTEYKTYEVEYGATITPEEAPTKEGYTFSGWSEIPETMPAHDVTVTGTFSINKYKLTYLIDGEEYKSYEVEYGATITPEPAPTKEGYEFSGWSPIPATMPAENLTITGTFTQILPYDEIKITSAGQTTWCSKYDLDFTEEEGLKVYTATGYKRSTGTIWLSRVKEVPAGEGILIMGDEGVYKIPHRTTTAYYANLMVGTLEAMTLNETDGEYTNYYLSNGKEGVGFYKVNGSVKLGANRAYLPLKKGTSGNANTRYIGLSFDDGTTDLRESMNNGSDEPDVYYNLQGQRIDNPTKGLYIKNGRKVVIK